MYSSLIATLNVYNRFHTFKKLGLVVFSLPKEFLQTLKKSFRCQNLLYQNS